jgi:ribosomal protein S12 methylthiotransferase accessory factor
MEFVIDFPGGAKVDAQLDSFTFKTDQPVTGGGEGSAPTPFQLFLASLGTCAGIFVLGFCRQRGLPTEGIRLIERTSSNPVTHMVDKVDLEIQVPPTFPQKYYDALVNAASLCTVKKHLENPPKFNVYTQVVA